MDTNDKKGFNQKDPLPGDNEVDGKGRGDGGRDQKSDAYEDYNGTGRA